MKIQKLLLALVLLTAGCQPKALTPPPTAGSASSPVPGVTMIVDSPTGITLPEGYHIDVIARDFKQPTHIAYGPDGALYISQLNGGENDGNGQVVRIKAAGATPEVVLSNLDKPTGLTWAAGKLYIVVRNNVVVSHVDNNNQFSTPDVVFENLAFNGRSNGQIFTGPDGNLYFQSTGNETKASQSGFIYIASPDSKDKQIYARGLKNAYAMAWEPQTGHMYATEIGDGNITGVGQPPEELNLIRRGGDYGWPFCYADQKENKDWGGSRDICADTDVPLALFPPESTPTGLAVYDGKLIVALWNGSPPRLLSVNPANGDVAEFATGFKRPMALLALAGNTVFDGLLIVDMDGGIVYRLTKNTP